MNRFFLEEADSTNKYAKEHIEELEDKTVVYTYNQTSGRGRLNRKWSYGGKDNIYASIVLKPSCEMKDVYSNLTQYLSVVLAQTFEEYGVIPKIKWPNDIRINGKKISGILAEVAGINDNVKKLCNKRLSFSDLTFPHGLFRGVLLEQIYRSFKIINNESYHK